MKVKVYHNGDDTFIAWKPDGFIKDCRGFALFRRRNGVEEIVSTWVGFEGDEHEDGERRASTNWPIQKYQWTDYMAAPGDTLQYRVVPIVGPDKNNLRADHTHASQWTEKIKLTHEVSPGIEVYFNRGIVASQWVSRRLGITGKDLKGAKLAKVIATPGDGFRNYLAGPLGKRLFEILASAVKEKRHVYAVLYELDDPQLEQALAKSGTRAHVVLGNGSVKKKGQDQNSDARDLLRKKVDLHDRMISPRALAHNKFLVICDKDKTPRWVWTGSQNWTKTGLCTQANNSLLIDDKGTATEYRKQWDLLRASGSTTPASLKQKNTKPRNLKPGTSKTRLWFTPTIGEVDLKEGQKIILGAKRAILFLMFNPGPRDSLLNSILQATKAKAGGTRLYIHGVINQDPSTTKNPVTLFARGNRVNADYEVVLPAAIDEATEFFRRELKKLPKAFAMVHSKVVLVDPFGNSPILLTGSHNLGPKASKTNDENLLIVRGAPGLAGAYATNIMAVYNQYRWRFWLYQAGARRWRGLCDHDGWQIDYLKTGSIRSREVNFWVD